MKKLSLREFLADYCKFSHLKANSEVTLFCLRGVGLVGYQKMTVACSFDGCIRVLPILGAIASILGVRVFPEKCGTRFLTLIFSSFR